MIEAAAEDFFDAKVIECPFPFYDRMLASDCPIVRIPDTQTYVVFSMDLVREVLGRPDDFSSRVGSEFTGLHADDPEIVAVRSRGWEFEETLLTADPPVHTDFRKLVNMAFSAPRVTAMELDIRRIAVGLLDTFIADGACEFAEQFAIPLPIHVIASQIGLAHVEYSKIRSWADAVADRFAGRVSRERELECAQLILEFQLTMVAEVERRKKEPRDDLLGALIEGQIDGNHSLTTGQFLSILQQLMVAGSETTAKTLTGGLLRLIRNRETMAVVRRERGNLRSVVEEILRIESPGQGLMRTANRDIELGGVAIPAGALIMPRLASANRDPAIFECPSEFRPGRSGLNRHVAFGSGIHACIGSMLARAEIRIGLEEVLDRMTEIALAPGYEEAYPYNLLVRGPASLAITFHRAS